jgi:hypothetical protein
MKEEFNKGTEILKKNPNKQNQIEILEMKSSTTQIKIHQKTVLIAWNKLKIENCV